MAHKLSDLTSRPLSQSTTSISTSLTLRVAREEGGVIPSRGRPEDVGLDLTVRSIKRDHRHDDLMMFVADLGVRVEPPPSCYIELLPRSSHAWSGFFMPNSVGVIDPEYRGVIMMPLIHLGASDRAEERAQSLIGTRVAQLVVRRHEYATVKLVEVTELSSTTRGEARFGSSGQ